MSSVEIAISSVVTALEESQAALRVVSSRLEAEFDRVYCSTRGSASASVNPARLAARLAALDAAVPAAADAVLALAHESLEAARAAKVAVVDSRTEAMKLWNLLPSEHQSGSTGIQDDVDANSVQTEKLEQLVARLSALVGDSQRKHHALVTAHPTSSGILSNDDLDMELLKAGLSSPSSSSSADKAIAKLQLECSNSPYLSRSQSLGKSSAWSAAKARLEQENGTENKENKRRSAKDVNPINNNPSQTSQPVPQNSKCPETNSAFVPITKAAHQRLPRMLKQQAKLDELNDFYERAIKLLSDRTRPMQEAELVSALGEDAMQKLDVLRRGFSLVKQTQAGWTLAVQVTNGKSKGKP